MIGRLNEGQIKSILQSQIVGRIGCHSKDKVYIVPITYVYSDGYIYCHSKPGQKIEMMRNNKEVQLSGGNTKSLKMKTKKQKPWKFWQTG